MTEQGVLIFIYLIQVIVFQFFTTPLMSKLSYKQALAKNKQWVLENNNILQKFPPPKFNLSYIAGIILLFILGYGAYVGNSKLLNAVNSFSILILLFQTFVIDPRYSREIKSFIPEPAIKEANLEPRLFSTYLSATKRYVLTALAIVSVTLWGAVLFTNNVSLTKELVVDFSSSFILIICFYSVLVYTINRSPLKTSLEASKYYRLLEIKFLYYSLIILFMRSIYMGCIYISESLNLWPFHSILNNLFFTLIPLITFAWFCFDKNIKELANESFVS